MEEPLQRWCVGYFLHIFFLQSLVLFYFIFKFLLLAWKTIDALRDSTKESIILGQGRIIKLTRMFPTLMPVYYVRYSLIINVYMYTRYEYV